MQSNSMLYHILGTPIIEIFVSHKNLYALHVIKYSTSYFSSYALRSMSEVLYGL